MKRAYPSRRAAAIQGRLRESGATAVFDEYWRFAVRRQAMLLRRLRGAPPPWTDDAILERHRFTNAYRVSDRVSQYLLTHVLYIEPQQPEEVVFRCLLFKLFNRISTWEALVAAVGTPERSTFSLHEYAFILDRVRASGRPLYAAAYIMPSPNLGATTKHENHLRLLRLLTSDAVLERLLGARRFADVYEALRAMPSLGPFLAFQFATDLNYTSYLPFGEESFVVAGPGARDGIAKCFAGVTPREANEVIMWTYESQEDHLQRLGLHFDRLAGRPLQPIDCQNLYCEIGKYARAAFPGVPGTLGRARIKQSYSPVGAAPLPPLVVPGKWVTANWRSRPNRFEAPSPALYAVPAA
jgi:hypothetical protein